MPSEPHGAHGEREIKKFRVTKRELLNNLSNIYKYKVSPGGTFHWEISSSMRENYQVYLGHKEKMKLFSRQREKNGQKQGHLCSTYMYASV